MHKATAVLLLLVAAALAYPQIEDADRIIDEIFGGPQATNTNDNTDKNTKDDSDKRTIDNTDKNTGARSKGVRTAFRETGEPCIIKKIAGVCTPYYLCKNDIISKAGVIDLAMKEDQYYCASYVDVCCTRENIMDKVDVEGL